MKQDGTLNFSESEDLALDMEESISDYLLSCTCVMDALGFYSSRTDIQSSRKPCETVFLYGCNSLWKYVHNAFKTAQSFSLS